MPKQLIELSLSEWSSDGDQLIDGLINWLIDEWLKDK